jgi:hypothetical protein
VNQMAESREPGDATSIEERLIDQVGDAIGGEGSLSFLSGGSVGHRHSVIAHVLEEAVVMGCLVAVCDCARSAKDIEPLTAALYALDKGVSGGTQTAKPRMPPAPIPAERSYRAEMAGLNTLRSIARNDPVVLVVEGLETADKATIKMLLFLARNIGDMNVLMIATHRSLEEDQLIVEGIEGIRHEALVHDLHIHSLVGDPKEDEVPIRHPAAVQNVEMGGVSAPLPSATLITERISSSHAALASGNVRGSIDHAQAALSDSICIGHYGLMIDSYLALGVALTQAGRERGSLDALDHAIGLAMTVGEVRSQHAARVRRSELLLFSVGEPDSAYTEAASAAALWSMTPAEPLRIEPLALMAIVQAGNGRRDRAERAFCDASDMLESQPADKLALERMMLALAAALLLESRQDLSGMNKIYGEAVVLATGTDSPEYWAAMVSLQQGRSLLRLRRPRESKSHLDDATRRFDGLGNAVQSARVKRAAEESEVGPVLD